MQTLGKFLKDNRVKAGLSQWQVAKMLGYSTSQFISNQERDIALPPAKDVIKMAQAYKVDVGVMKQAYIDQSMNKHKQKVLESFKGL
jgi:transcriptional regulator with XRE-family HTH domain